MTLVLMASIFFEANSQTSYYICRQEDLSSVVLRLFYDSGKISGYVIFRDQKGEMCSIDSEVIPLLICGDWIESLEIIRPDRFEVIPLNSTASIFAYTIKPTPFTIPLNSTVKITFKWGDTIAVDEVSNYSRADLERDLYQLPIIYQDRKSKARQKRMEEE